MVAPRPPWRRWWAALAAASLLFGCTAPEEITDVVYDGRYDATRLDLYLPDGDEPLRPAVMFVHGGAWRGGDKDNFQESARRLARSGYVAASINYRLAPEGQFPEPAQDVACALAFLQSHAGQYHLDAGRIAVMGYSAGGHLVSLLGVTWDLDELAPDCDAGRPTKPAAVIPGAGVHDLRDADHQWVEDFMGGTTEQLPETYALASPIVHVAPGAPPYLFINGAADWLADVNQARAMQYRLLAEGNQAELLSLAGGGHLLNPGVDPGDVQIGLSTDTPEAWLALADFLARTVGEP